MSSAGHLSELESLRSQVADLTRTLTERDQSMQAQSHHLEETMQDLREQSHLLHTITEGTAAEAGEEFFAALVTHLTRSLNVQYAIVGEVVGEQTKTVRTLAVSSGGQLVDNFEYGLVHTPCETALERTFACYERGVQDQFPRFTRLAELGVEGYSGIPLRTKAGLVNGLLVVMDTKPLRNTERLKSLLAVFASRTGAELQRQQAEAARRESEARLRFTQFAVDHAEDGILWADDSKRFIYANEAACRLLGYANEELLALSISDIAPYHDPTRFQQRLDQIKQGTAAIYESIHRRKDGTEFPIEASVTYLEHEGRGYSCGIVRDITARKRTEHERMQALYELQNIMETVPDIMFTLDAQGNMVKWNRRVEDVTGYSPEELLNKPALAFVPPEEQTRTAAVIQRAFTDGYAELDGRLLTKEQRLIPYHWTGALLKNSHGEPIGITGIGRDVSDKKRGEEAVRKSEERLALAVEGSNDILWDAHRLPGEPWYAPQTPIWWSPRVRELLGLEESELFETLDRWAMRLHPDDKDRVFGQLAAHIEHRVPYDAEYRLRNNRGDYLWIRGRGQAMWDEQGQIRRMSGSCQDITERKQTAKQLAEAYSMLHQIVTNIPLYVFWKDRESNYLGCNRLVAESAGVGEPAAIVGKNDYALEWRETAELYRADDRHVMETNTPKLSFEEPMTRPDGSVFWLRTSKVPLQDQDGKVFGVLGICEDITERKRTEEALQMQASVLRRMLEGVSLSDENGVILYTNSAEDAMFGYEPGELIGKHVTVLNTYPPEENVRIVEGVIEQLKAKGSWEGEFSNRRKDGSPFTTFAHITALELSGKKHWVCVQEDITERKQAEESLRVSEERFDLAVRGSNTGIWDWDLRTNKTYFSPLWKSMLGHEEHELRGEFSDWEERLHPDDRERSLATVRAYLDGTTPQYELEHRLRHKDGSYRWILARGVSISDAEGNPYRMAGSHIDITEQKQTQEALAQSERQLRTVLDALPVGVWFTDPSGKPVLANPAAKQIWSGIKQIRIENAANTAGWWEAIGPSSELHRWALSPVLTRGVPSLNETLDFECLDGTKKTIRNTTVPVQDEAGVVLGAIVLNEDITALRQAQEALKLTQFSVDHAVEGFFWIGPDASILNANEAACRMLEYTREELTTMTVHDINPNFPPKAWLAHWEELKQHGSMTFESKHWSKTGRVLDIEITVSYLRYEGNEYNCAIMRDIGERKRVDAALRTSEERYRALYDDTPTMYFTLATDGTVLSVNRFGAEQLGYRVEELVGHTVLGVFHEDDKEVVAAGLSECLATPEATRHWEFRKVQKDGSIIWVRETARVSQSSNGETVVLVTCEDITERKRVEDALRASEERYRSLVDNAPIGIFVNEDGRFAYVNQEMQRILNATSTEQLIGTTVLDRIGPEFHQVVKDRIHALMDNRQPVPSLDAQYVRLDGSRVDVAVTAIPTSFDGTPVMQVLVLDIAERKRMEEALRQRERDLRAAVEERERISQDLHDGILQSLFAVGLTLEVTKSMMSSRTRKTSGPPLDQAIDQLNRVMHEIRNFIAGLGSDLLQGKDLPTALQHMLKSLTQNQAMHVRLAVEDRAAQAVSAKQALHLFLVIQEAVSNCIRHGRAPEARVSLKMLKQGVRLSIRDNGCGFNPKAAKGTGHGLSNMAARAQKIGGRFTVLSKVNEGTRIVLDLPKEASVVHR